jgi:potassium-dependent mechanosensitive channel
MHFSNKILFLVLAVMLLWSPSLLFAQEPERVNQKTDVSKEPALSAPDLADIVPLATALTGRQAALENRIKGGLDLYDVQKRYDSIATDLNIPADELKRLKKTKDYRFNRLLEIKQTVERENHLFQEIGKPIRRAIQALGTWRNAWLKEQKQWRNWESSLLAEGEFIQLQSTFQKAHDTIETALYLILSRLEAMLTLQEKAGQTQAKLNALAAELDNILMEKRRGAVISTSPPMLSSAYLQQFGTGMENALKHGLVAIPQQESRSFLRQGWILLLQVLFSLFIAIVVYRNRRSLAESNRWAFLAERFFSTGFFLGGMAIMLLHEYEGAPALWKLVNIIVFGLSFARLSSGIMVVSWKRASVYGLMTLLMLTRLMDVLALPLSLFRCYMVLAALAGLLLCVRWSRENKNHEASSPYTLILRLAAIHFAVIILLQLWGKASLALFLFISFIDSMATALVFILYLYMIHGGLEWLFRRPFIMRTAHLYGDDVDAVIKRVSRFIDVAVCGLVLLPGLLMIWDVYDSLGAATRGLLSLGFNLGDQRVSIGLLLVAAVILYGSYLTSWVLRKLLMDEVLVKRRVEKGVRLSMSRLVHYAIVFIGFLLALSSLGFEVSKITILLSALGVGIGFGLQGVVNNFVSGLILLFERPVRMGDTIEINGKWSEIKHIGIRATTVQTVDQADLIIPNADLINTQVTNWTLSNRRVRVAIPVGVAYGSDIPLVIQTLAACAGDHEKVSTLRAPDVLFLNFGESSLDFELRVWVTDADYRLNVKSDLHQEIDSRFREAGIEIAFPQRDLHLRSVDDSVRFDVPAKSSATEKT